MRAPVRGEDRRAGAVRAEPDRRAAGAPARLHRVDGADGLGARARFTDDAAGSPRAVVAILDGARARSTRAPTPSLPSATRSSCSSRRSSRRRRPTPRVNQVTPALFARYPDASALAAADPAEVEALDPVDRLLPAEGAGVDRHGAGARRRSTAARCPRTMDGAASSCRASGARPPTSCSGTRSACPGFPVDRHVLRVANRLGLAASDDPETVEAAATAVVAAAGLDARLGHAHPARPAHLQARRRCATAARCDGRAPCVRAGEAARPPRAARPCPRGAATARRPERREGNGRVPRAQAR